MSLLQDVLRTKTLDSLEKKLMKATINGRISPDDDDYELINVISLPGTPASRSRPSSRPTSRPSSRATSPTRRALRATPQRPSSDPLRAFPTEITQKIFGRLSVKELAKCSRVSKKWSKSQTINYVWFQHYRKENFHDDSLPAGKWTKRESKQNWRTTYISTLSSRSPSLGPLSPSNHSSRSNAGSGYQTPREIKEEKWRSEAEASAKPSKLEMREMYKELGGRKMRGKGKVASVGAGSGGRDRGGWGEDDGW
ncbi:hypothetical protein NLI96_g2170 [Meripilus lineatus]|uniref:F-box domain-containing protein n=1 Tax=Meripilus lineatus TaxID=2056292 RepID=A0AAD5YM95_9APHY|nr:hypothetical protein NLI96_g2170 [Physisporinus lineatus]